MQSATPLHADIDLRRGTLVSQELLVGRPPFGTASADALLACHVHEPFPSLKAQAPRAAPELEGFLARLVARDPEKRFATYTEVLQAGALLLPRLLVVWIGKSLPSTSGLVAQTLAWGLVPYTIGTMYVALIHAHRRVDINAKAHLIEAPLYGFALYWLTIRFGVVGAAWAWVGRVTADTLITVIWFELYNSRDKSINIRQGKFNVAEL